MHKKIHSRGKKIITNKTLVGIVNEFIDFVENDTNEIEDKDKHLMMLLDSLGLSIAHCKYTFDEKEYPEAPEIDYKKIRTVVEKKFKNYGFYNIPEEIENNLSNTKTYLADST